MWRKTRKGAINNEQREEYKKLDATITECMVASKKNLTPPDISGKSKEQILILSKIKYYKLLYQRLQGQPVNDDVLRKAREKLNIKINSNDPKELHTLTNRGWREWREYNAKSA